MFNIFNTFTWILSGKMKGDADDINTLTLNDYYNRLKLIALSLFEWENLPESCNARYLENALYSCGQALFVNDESLGYLTIKATPSGELNVYDESLSYVATSTGYNKKFEKKDCVLIRNNYLERPTDNTVVLFANRLTESERTIDVNVKAQKTPVLILCAENERMTLQNVYKKFNGNEPVIFGGKALNIDALKVLKTDAPFIALDMQNYKHQIWNEALTFFGINNANSDKRERLITNEVDANDEVIFINAEAMLLTRLEACQQINKKFGLNISVKKRTFKPDILIDEGKEENE